MCTYHQKLKKFFVPASRMAISRLNLGQVFCVVQIHELPNEPLKFGLGQAAWVNPPTLTIFLLVPHILFLGTGTNGLFFQNMFASMVRERISVIQQELQHECAMRLRLEPIFFQFIHMYVCMLNSPQNKRELQWLKEKERASK